MIVDAFVAGVLGLLQEEAVQLIRSLRSEVADLTGRLETL